MEKEPFNLFSDDNVDDFAIRHARASHETLPKHFE